MLWLVVGALLYTMRRMERWLHQHIFKVGWLVTKNLRATTVFYYIFFLPGVVLHELIFWLVAGILNVRADRAIAAPEAQQIAEMKLNFIRLAKNTHRVKAAIISVAPLLGGLAVIWLITNDVLNINRVMSVLNAGGDPWEAINLLLLTPDVWIWVYLMFAIANTMTPDREALRGWRPVAVVLIAFVIGLYVVGLGQQVFMENLALPISGGLSGLALILGVIIVIDLIVTGILGTIEAIIERITGDSATFQNGKLIAITREELQREREQQRAKEERQRQQAKAQAPAGGPPSIYKLPLPIPGAPGKESEAVTVRRDDKSTLPAGGTMPPRSPAPPDSGLTPRPSTPPTMPARPAPQVIPGTASPKADDAEEKDTAIPLPAPSASKPPMSPVPAASKPPLSPVPAGAKKSLFGADDEDDKPAVTRPPLSPVPASAKKPSPFGGDDEDEQEDDKPPVRLGGTMPPRSPVPASRTSPAFNTNDDEDDNRKTSELRPAPVTGGTMPPRSPVPASRTSPAFGSDDDEDEKPASLVRGTMPPRSPVPTNRTPPAFNANDDDEDEDEKPSAFVGGTLPPRPALRPSPKPTAFSPSDDEDEDEDDEVSDEDRPRASVRGAFSQRSPVPSGRKTPPAFSSDNEDDDRATMEIPAASVRRPPPRSPVPSSLNPPIFNEGEDDEADQDEDEDDEERL